MLKRAITLFAILASAFMFTSAANGKCALGNEGMSLLEQIDFSDDSSAAMLAKLGYLKFNDETIGDYYKKEQHSLSVERFPAVRGEGFLDILGMESKAINYSYYLWQPMELNPTTNVSAYIGLYKALAYFSKTKNSMCNTVARKYLLSLYSYISIFGDSQIKVFFPKQEKSPILLYTVDKNKVLLIIGIGSSEKDVLLGRIVER